MTKTHGGSFQSASSLDATTANPKSARSLIALVQTGLYSVASKSPTTAALMPRNADRNTDLARIRSQNGSTPITSRTAGRKMPTSAISPPTQQCGLADAVVPR